MIGWRVLIVGAGVLGIGCAETAATGDDDSSSDGDQLGATDDPADDGTDRGDGLPPVGEIVIPMRPSTTASVSPLAEITETHDGPTLIFEQRIALALGTGYPTKVSIPGPEAWFAVECGDGAGQPSLNELSLSPAGDSESVSAQLQGADVIDVEVLAPGQTLLIAQGEVTLAQDACGHLAGTPLPLQLRLTMVVHQADKARVQLPCTPEGTVAVAPSSGPGDGSFDAWFGVALVDEQGEEFVAANADPLAQAGVVLAGSFDAGHAMPASLGEWITPSRVGTVTITPELGEAVRVEVVGPERITGVELEFQLAGAAAGPTTLVAGMKYGPGSAGGWGRAANRIAPMIQEVTTQWGRLCSAPAAGWWQLETLTPEVCSIVSLPPLRNGKPDGYTLYGDRTGQAGRIEKAGTCTLHLNAPGASPESGLPVTFGVDVGDPTGLHEL